MNAPSHQTPKQIIKYNRQKSTHNAGNEIQECRSALPSKEKEQITEHQTTKSGIGSQEADGDEQTTCGTKQNGCICQGRKKRQQEGTCQVDEQDVVRPAFAEIGLDVWAEQCPGQCTEKSSCKNCGDATTC